MLFTTEAVLEKHPELVVAVTEACRKGWAYALDHKEDTIDLILNSWKEDINRDYQIASLEKVESLVRPDGEAIMPWTDLSTWDEMQKLLLEFELLPSPVDLVEFLYTQDH